MFVYWIFCNVKDIVKIKCEKLYYCGNDQIYILYGIYRVLFFFEILDVIKYLLQFLNWFCLFLKYYLIIIVFMCFRENKLNGMGNVLKKVL